MSNGTISNSETAPQVPTIQDNLDRFAVLRGKLNDGSISLEEKEEITKLLKEIPVDPGYSAFVEQSRLMAQINAYMREKPLESEKPVDVNPLLKVEMPPDGGILTYMGNMEHPYKGFPYFDMVDRLDLLKKIGRAAISGVYHSFKGWKRVKLLFLLPVIRQVVWIGIYTYYRFIERFKIKSLIYCPALRELHRTFSIRNPNESVKEEEARFMLRDLVCMVLEFDNAYRFRFQDLIVELDKKELREKPIKELNRLFQIGQKREKTQEIRDTWTLIRLGIRFYLRLDKKMLRMIQNALLELDLKKCELDEGDKSYCKPRKDYTFGFQENVNS